MKNTIFLAASVLFFSAANAQTDTTTKETTSATTTTTTTGSPATATTTTTATSASITIPDHLKGVSSDNIRPEHYLPVLGSFQPSGSSTANLTITVDEQNIGIVWIDGLPQGRVKGLLKKSPATYKIPAQKTAEGKSVPEGTLVFNPATKEISIYLGKAFNDADPSAVFTSETKGKSKGWNYTGIKAEATAMQAPVSN
jgi:hypothetical protein